MYSHYDFPLIFFFWVSQAPVLHDVRSITLGQTARNGLVALISYEHTVRRITQTLNSS